MQNVLGQLQKMIKSQFGLESQLDILNEETSPLPGPFGYLPESSQLHVPIFDHKKEKIIARFKVYDVQPHSQDVVSSINDLVLVTLQSYLDLMNKLDITDNVLAYMQRQASPGKIIPFQKGRRETALQNTIVTTAPQAQLELSVRNRELLLFGKNQGDLKKLFIHLHESTKNNSLITIDENSSILSQEDELNNLFSTTIVIPNIKRLSVPQLITLKQLLGDSKLHEQQLLLAASMDSLVMDTSQDQTLIEVLNHLHFFYILSDQRESHGASFSTLQLCAETIVQMMTGYGRNELEKAPYTRSYNIVPLVRPTTPTLLH